MLKKPKQKSRLKSSNNPLKNSWEIVWAYAWKASLWRRIMVVFFVIIFFLASCMFGLGQWYIQKHKKEPLVLGTTFISDYAESFGLDPRETLDAILGDAGIKRVRFVSYWKEIEATPGTYDFSELDWQFEMAQKYGADVSLAIGMRQPRWPECHEPKWLKITDENKNEWQPKLFDYMTAVINRYKNNPALREYQLENEFFMTVFGECKNFDRERLVKEFNMVKQLDNKHPVSISRSNNWIGLPLGEPRPDVFGISVYKRVWDKTITKRYYEYPLPPVFYAALAGGGEIMTGNNMFIHELQSEPWTPRDLYITDTPIAEQFKSFNAKRFKDRIEYAKDTGMRTIDLWGVEWWYWLKQKHGDPSVWNVAKDAVKQAEDENKKLTPQN